MSEKDALSKIGCEQLFIHVLAEAKSEQRGLVMCAPAATGYQVPGLVIEVR